MTKITDHGELDYLTPVLSDTDKAIARQARIALDAQREARNAQDRLTQAQANERAIAALVGIR